MLTGTPVAAITGDGYSLHTDASSTVSSGGSTIFIITFAPATPGIKTGTISIISNDSDQNPYEFTIHGASLTTETLIVVDGYSSKDNLQSLSSMGKTDQVLTSDDDSWPIDKGDNYWTSFQFSDPASSPVYIDSVVIYCEHYEESEFVIGNIIWQVGTGWPISQSVWDTHIPSVRTSDTIDTWNVSSFITLTNINNIEFCIQNNDNDKLTFQDYIYIEIKYAP
jgi:hypothetical protein